MLRLLSLLGSLFIAVTVVRAQQFGGNPSSLKWRQINNDTARIIFPVELEKQAQEIAGLIQKMAGDAHQKVNIVLQNQTLVSNGYVGLGPFRSEFYMTPRQNSFELGSLPWHKSLTLHEYRHVQQYNSYRRGLSKWFYFLFGEEGQALANSVAVPDWFFEGDAVDTETRLSTQGRGRIPFFYNDYRAIWSAGKDYSWMKLRNGSYRDFVPDHYRLGYMLTLHGREKYGEDFWRKVTNDAAAFKGLFYPMQKAVQRHSGQSYKSFVNDALTRFNPGEQDDTSARYGKHRHFRANEEFPYFINDSVIIYLKSSYQEIPTFYVRHIWNGKEERIAYRDISIDNYYSYRNGKIIYASYQPDARWGWKNFGILKILDIQTGRTETIGARTKYLSPDISDDGKKIVAVHNDPDGSNLLHLINRETGETTVIPNREALVYTYPKFLGDSIVSAVRNQEGAMALLLIAKDGEYRTLVPFSTNIIGFPFTSGDTISFTMSYEGQEQLFAIIDHHIYRFEPRFRNHSTGNYHLASRNGHFAWMMFTAAGYHSLTGEGRFLPFQFSQESSVWTTPLPAERPTSPYKKSFQLFNFHSWRPFINDPEYSYSLVGENILSTMRSELFLNYNRNEDSKEAGATIAYGGWYPVVNAGGSFIFDRSFRDSGRAFNWNEWNASLGVSLPLSFTRGIYYQQLRLATSINSRQVSYTGIARELYEDRRFNFLEMSLAFTNQRQKVVQNIYPKWAQSFSARHRFIVSKYRAYQFSFNGALYVPGLFTNHSLVLQGAYQLRDTLQQYNFSNLFSLPRGYSDLNFPRMWKIGANYHFPIVYPDKGFANIVYLLRVRGNLFYDYSQLKSLRTGQTHALRSTGIEIYFDTRWWNQLPVNFGLRYSRLIDHKLTGLSPHQWEFILPLTLLSR